MSILVDGFRRRRRSAIGRSYFPAFLAAAVIGVGMGAAALSGSAPAFASSPSTPGPWTIANSANTSSTQDNRLSGVSCISPTACTAVGEYSPGGNSIQTLIEVRSGSTWSIVSSPNASGNDVLAGVACTGPATCIAVGEYFDASFFSQTLIESWNGSTWSIVPSPNTSPTQNNMLAAVSCISPTACTAVGTGAGTLVESWNGSTWSIVPSPSPVDPTTGSVTGSLTGVSCVSSSACTAVGYYGIDFVSPTGRRNGTLIESWNGSTWSIVSSPSQALNSQLNGVSCSGPANCTAVGFGGGTVARPKADQTLVESWNGSTWSVVPSPDIASRQSNILGGVSCANSMACTAVGSFGGRSGKPTLIESWNGTAWALAAGPHSRAQFKQLNGVSCSGPTICTAVGFDRGASTFQTLIETAG